MTDKLNPIAPHYLPPFITAPGETDVLFNVMVVFVVVCVIGLGVIFFTIHTLPERYAHRTKKVQLDVVAVLGLLALLTNEHIFWFAALLLAFIDFPDFLTPVQRIASAVEGIAGQENAGETAGDQFSAGSSTERAPSEKASRMPGAAETPNPIQGGAAHA